jgi:hypothetical protein
MLRTAIVIAFVCSTLSLGACDGPTTPNTLPLVVQAAADQATRPEHGQVLRCQITNVGASELYLSSCNHQILVAVDREENGVWTSTSADACPAIFDMVPIRITAGEILHGTRSFDGQPGRYRVVAWGHRWTDSTAGTALISNVVVIE